MSKEKLSSKALEDTLKNIDASLPTSLAGTEEGDRILEEVMKEEIKDGYKYRDALKKELSSDRVSKEDLEKKLKVAVEGHPYIFHLKQLAKNLTQGELELIVKVDIINNVLAMKILNYEKDLDRNTPPLITSQAHLDIQSVTQDRATNYIIHMANEFMERALLEMSVIGIRTIREVFKDQYSQPKVENDGKVVKMKNEEK